MTYGEEEYDRKIEPYQIYLAALESVFDLNLINSFADFGCSNGKLLESLKEKYPSTKIIGLEYFEWAKKYASEKIVEFIKIEDLSKNLDLGKKYNIVNCSEVGEHLDKKYEEILIKNITKHSDDIVILTWSNDRIDPKGQHINPQKKSYIIKKVEAEGFYYWSEATQKISDYLKINLESVGNSWWSKNIMVFKKISFLKTKSRYFIQGIETDNDKSCSPLKTNVARKFGKSFLQDDFRKITRLINASYLENKGLSILRASDGDYLFLRQIPIGSAKPGNRALTKKYSQLNMNLYKSMFWHNDLITINLGSSSIKEWRNFIVTETIERFSEKIFKNNNRVLIFIKDNKYFNYSLDKILNFINIFGVLSYIVSYLISLKRGSLYLENTKKLISGKSLSCESVYSIISNKWIFKNFPTEIGIIAPKEKIELIKELQKNDDYKKYLGIQEFSDFIEIPQIGAADDVEKLYENIRDLVKNSRAKIFLVGSGSSKLALIPLLKIYSNKIFIDAGAGIDAIAGIICQERPYFANWTNYRLKNYNYDQVDFMDKNNPAWKNETYKTIYL
ncbi:class I SAM-dependent methyltransferase [Candidatus Gracilibacteria bacterium]|nr:class I SAM-dependent methyltransferase [Candidatus Gracilibacteria bacterium]